MRYSRWPIKAILFVSLVLICAACIKNVKSNPNVPDITIRDEGIYHQGRLYAELRFFKGGGEDGIFRGFGIYYFPIESEEWIYPDQGWSLMNFKTGKKLSSIQQIDAIWGKDKVNTNLLYNGRNMTKGEFISTWCRDVKITKDGKYVTYRIPGFLYNSTHEYKVDYSYLNP